MLTAPFNMRDMFMGQFQDTVSWLRFRKSLCARKFKVKTKRERVAAERFESSLKKTRYFFKFVFSLFVLALEARKAE